MVDCFRLFVRYLSHADNIFSANSFKLRGDIWKNHFLGILLKCRQALGLTIRTIAAPSKTLASIPRWILAGCEDFVRHSIRSDFDPCRSWPISEMDGGYAWFSCSKKLSRLHCLAWQSNVETREESTICLQRCDLFLASWSLLCMRCTEQCQFILWHNVTQWFVGCTFSLSSTNSLNWPISSTAFTVHIAYLFMTTFVSRVSMSPLSSRNGFLMSSNVANREYTT